MTGQIERHAAEARAAEPSADWTAEQSDVWLRRNCPEAEPGVPTVIVGADGKRSSGDPSVQSMLNDIAKHEAADAEKAKSSTESEYRRFFQAD